MILQRKCVSTHSVLMVIFITVCVRQCVVHGAEDNYGDVSKLSTPENFSGHSFPFNIFPILDSISHEAERDTEIVKNTMENAWEQIEVKGREGYQWTQNKTEEELFNLSAPLLVEEFAANQTIHDVEDKAWEGYQWTQNKTEEEVLTLSAPLLVEEFEANQTIHDVEENVISTGEQFRDWSISTWNIISDSFHTILRIIEVVGGLVFVVVFYTMAKKLQNFFTRVFTKSTHHVVPRTGTTVNNTEAAFRDSSV